MSCRVLRFVDVVGRAKNSAYSSAHRYLVDVAKRPSWPVGPVNIRVGDIKNSHSCMPCQLRRFQVLKWFHVSEELNIRGMITTWSNILEICLFPYEDIVIYISIPFVVERLIHEPFNCLSHSPTFMGRSVRGYLKFVNRLDKIQIGWIVNGIFFHHRVENSLCAFRCSIVWL